MHILSLFCSERKQPHDDTVEGRRSHVCIEKKSGPKSRSSHVCIQKKRPNEPQCQVNTCFPDYMFNVIFFRLNITMDSNEKRSREPLHFLNATKKKNNFHKAHCFLFPRSYTSMQWKTEHRDESCHNPASCSDRFLNNILQVRHRINQQRHCWAQLTCAGVVIRQMRLQRFQIRQNTIDLLLLLQFVFPQKMF